MNTKKEAVTLGPLKLCQRCLEGQGDLVSRLVREKEMETTMLFRV